MMAGCTLNSPETDKALNWPGIQRDPLTDHIIRQLLFFSLLWFGQKIKQQQESKNKQNKPVENG